MNILIVDDDNAILELICIIVENAFESATIVRASCPNTAIAELDRYSFDLIICDYEMPPFGTGEDVYIHLRTHNSETQFLLFTSRNLEEVDFLTDSNDQRLSSLQKPARPKDITAMLNKILNYDGDGEQSKYRRVPIYNFTRFNYTKCSIFIEINKEKYVKIINKEHEYEMDFIQRYIQKEIKYFYILAEDYEDFLVEFTSTNFLKNTNSESDFLENAKKQHLYLASLVKQLGISQYSIDESSKLALQAIEQAHKSSFKGLIESLLKSNDYSYDHTFLITCICSHISGEVGLTKQANERLAMASLIHDLGIERADLNYIHDIRPEKIKDLTYDEQQIIRKHVKLLENNKNFTDISDEIQKILTIQHSFDENYPYNESQMNTNNSVTTLTFLVAHAFSNELYHYEFKPEKLREIFTILNYKFAHKNFYKILKAIKDKFLITDEE
ncbi:response regulator [Bacteriovorax sp. Seq25_V]|uniref:response regulator n=1 Tax=Bacteriovorax sp. Seq25_V TaxID=1201288 RepID=UPI00038A493F|nr:response regulator [Bacteriovorax sp. Seq25_V]EQC43817.1 response regulator receiver domain protein [Bacteriovorax sp. Seq25_V]